MSALVRVELAAGLQPAHIRDYAYPPGDDRRYTHAGWERWQEYALTCSQPASMDGAPSIHELLKHRGGGV